MLSGKFFSNGGFLLSCNLDLSRSLNLDLGMGLWSISLWFLHTLPANCQPISQCNLIVPQPCLYLMCGGHQRPLAPHHMFVELNCLEKKEHSFSELHRFFREQHHFLLLASGPRRLHGFHACALAHNCFLFSFHTLSSSS